MNEIASQSPLLIGIDIGGTFTDFVLYDIYAKKIRSLKVLSTPEAPEKAVIQGLATLLEAEQAKLSSVQAVFHGSTVATNALLERKGARTALITTSGFGDVLEIGRQNRPELYNLSAASRPPLIPKEKRLEVQERLDKTGQILVPLPQDLGWVPETIRRLDVEAVAICLLFSFLNPEHEHRLHELLRGEDLFVCLSSDVLPEFREYERTSTTVINAYVTPVLKRYLNLLEGHLGGTKFYVMQSNGGSISATEASHAGVRCILSGPAGGVAAATFIRSQAQAFQRFPGRGMITFDMGGTSTDVSLIKDTPELTREAQIDGYPIALSILDIHTIGSGGGSIAAIDTGGALIVGPQSAGADPGPACYGKGDLPTVTDANLVLGRIKPDYFLGGKMRLHPSKAFHVIENLAEQLSVTVPVCAAGIVEIANTHMAKALRVISVERGEDPADFTLVSFGGAGGLHAVELARMVGIQRVFIPQSASVFSAFGMLVADTVKNYARTVMSTAERGYEWFRQAVEPLRDQAKMELNAEGIPAENQRIQLALDMRYQGQSYEITIPLLPDFVSHFHDAHRQAYGYHLQEHAIEVVNLRVQAVGRKPEQILLAPEPQSDGELKWAHLGDYPVFLNSPVFPQVRAGVQQRPIPFFLAERIPVGAALHGPAVIIRPDTTLFIGRKDNVQVDELRNVIITLEGDE